MFLKKVYRYNKWMFGGMLFFVLMQLLVSYKRGMLFSPWYNYGMYSERSHLLPSYSVLQVDSLKGSDYTPQQWDKIYYSLARYRALSLNDSLFRHEIRRLFPRFFFIKPDSAKFHCSLAPADFAAWYTHTLKSVCGKEVPVTGIRENSYQWNGTALVLKP